MKPSGLSPPSAISMLIEDELHDTDCHATHRSHTAGPKLVLQSWRVVGTASGRIQAPGGEEGFRIGLLDIGAEGGLRTRDLRISQGGASPRGPGPKGPGPYESGALTRLSYLGTRLRGRCRGVKRFPMAGPGHRGIY